LHAQLEIHLKTILATVALLIAASGSAHALTGAKLAEEKQCMQCHAIDKDTIGPSFQKIKAIYKGMKNPQAKLIDVMRLGSDAHLGPLNGRARMPDSSERPTLNDREAKQLARWILD
jgi:cytochrome c